MSESSVVLPVGRYDVVTNVDSCFLQMLLWERFYALSPKPMELPHVVMEEAVSIWLEEDEII